MKKTFLLLALSLTLLLGACSAQTPAAGSAPPVETPAEAAAETPAEPEPSLSSFTALDLEGNEVDESIFADYDLTMINIWATFCSPCLRELPELGELASAYADKGVRIVGIVADVSQKADGSFNADQVNTARELVEQTGADYLQLLPSADLVAAKLNEVSAVPETIFVDSGGNLVGSSYIGSRSGQDWAEIIDALLSQL